MQVGSRLILSSHSAWNSESLTRAQSDEVRDSHMTTYTPTSSSTTEQTICPCTFIPSNKNGKWKERSNNGDNDGRSNDFNRNSKRQNDLPALPITTNKRNKFACPYRKKNPHTYCSDNKQWRSCALTPLESIARVK
jgi:hypothetical protein